MSALKVSYHIEDVFSYNIFDWQEVDLLESLVYPLIREELAENPDGVCSGLVPVCSQR